MDTDDKKAEDQPDEFYQDGIRPQIFKNFFGKNHPEFKLATQQDAREYMSHLLDRMHKGEVEAKTGQNPSDLFAFEQETRIQCDKCHRVSYQVKRE